MAAAVQVIRAEVVRSGTALAVGLADGATRLLRWIDLAPLLGKPDPATSRFAEARVESGAVEVELAGGGGRERLHAADVAGVAAHRPELVVETSGLLMTCDGGPDRPLGEIKGGAVVMGGGRILWVGPRQDLARSGLDLTGAARLDAGARLVTPGLIDCHAHPIFAGSRAGEFGQRAAGESYLDIARGGGGIAATVTATRAASIDDLIQLTCARLGRAVAAGTTTMEAKSGYDLTVDGELRMLEVALAADALSPVDLEPTLLGAHALPPGRPASERGAYVAEVAEQMVPRAAEARLARAVDVYCDEGAFTLEEARRVLDAGRRAGLLVRAHAGQFADLGCAELVADLGGVSADHLEQVGEAGMRAMAAHGVVAVMLPGACVQLRLAPPPVASLRQAGVALAVASDLNPGSSLSESLLVPMWLAATHYGMTIDEVWLGVTRHAARVLGRPDLGNVARGAAADLVVWEAEQPAEIPYRYGAGAALVHRVVKAGRPVAASA